MPVKQSTKDRYSDIRNEYKRLCNIKEFGVQKHHPNWIIRKLGKRFYKEPSTIENIIYHRV